MVDAYSLGFTLRYMLTGCLPRVRVKDAIKEKNSLVYVLFSSCTNRKKKRKVMFRPEEELPVEAQRLILRMTNRSEKKRESVRTARKDSWVSEVLPGNDPNYSDISYLKMDSLVGPETMKDE
jgi:serine/threonine protein kinase